MILSVFITVISGHDKPQPPGCLLENQLSISEGASRLSLPEGTLGQWVTAARKGLGTPGSRTVAELESEILQLRKALNEARLERDILKKATAYFAQESLKNTR
ncbi:transposase (plasmid) [Escherichia coli]|nr:transposase [Escherichia coli O165:H25 str. 2010C-4874]BDQ74301.1 transposase [Escherichia coli]BDQ79555.1 transposase [Escherichia coli]BDQ84881.1 transposase [Escherichia coli]BDQ90331.1 transposase [Escherichia coli]